MEEYFRICALSYHNKDLVIVQDASCKVIVCPLSVCSASATVLTVLPQDTPTVALITSSIMIINLHKPPLHNDNFLLS